MFKRIIRLTFILVLLVGAGGCSKPGDRYLSLEITFPANGAALENNLLRLTGVVSDPTANVTISYGTTQVGTAVSENGSFYGWVDLPKGASTVEVLATKNEKKVAKAVTVTFTPPLAVYPNYVSSNVTDSPTTVTGYVNKPEAKVTVNGVPAEVRQDGFYSAEILFEKGNNAVVAEASLGHETDRGAYGFEITPEGWIMPFRQVGPRAGFSVTSSNMSLKAGKTKSFDTWLATYKNTVSPTKFTATFIRIIDKSYTGTSIPEELKAPMPEGLEIFLEPNNFFVWPNATYSPELIIRATDQAVPGDYWFNYEYQGAGVSGGSGFSVIVTPGG